MAAHGNVLCTLMGAVRPDLKAKTEERLLAMSDKPDVPLAYREMVLSEFRVRCTLQAPIEWNFFYLGQPMERLTSAVRPIVQAQVSDNIGAFLEVTGSYFDHEFIREGRLFHRKNINASITQLKKMPMKGDVSSAVLLDPAWLVECWIITPDDKISEADTELQAFAEQLMPLVELVKPRAGQVNALMPKMPAAMPKR